MSQNKLGNKYTCFSCNCKFYDLNRKEPTCPRCKKDQREAPLPKVQTPVISREIHIPKEHEEPMDFLDFKQHLADEDLFVRKEMTDDFDYESDNA